MIDKALHIMDTINNFFQPLIILWLVFMVIDLEQKLKKKIKP